MAIRADRELRVFDARVDRELAHVRIRARVAACVAARSEYLHAPVAVVEHVDPAVRTVALVLRVAQLAISRPGGETEDLGRMPHFPRCMRRAAPFRPSTSRFCRRDRHGCPRAARALIDDENLFNGPTVSVHGAGAGMHCSSILVQPSMPHVRRRVSCPDSCSIQRQVFARIRFPDCAVPRPC